MFLSDRSLPQKVSYRFRYQQGRSPYYGVTRKWDISDREWRHGRRFILTAWPWMVLHSIVGRAVAYSVPSLLPHYHITFSLLFVSLKLSWMTTAYFVAVHAVFFVLSWMQVPALCYGLALLLVSHHDVFELDLLKDTQGNVIFQSFHRRDGLVRRKRDRLGSQANDHLMLIKRNHAQDHFAGTLPGHNEGRRIGFPMPLIPLLVSLYFGAYASQDVMEWESSAAEKSRVQ
ncbi:hypothetical protein V5799_019132 [Amblyomma americanum]|uniref:Uncharacterized protein n=1 Tax=Amblyomma americanum TaxID=6943 RepID=A0AAQ4EYC0_AMBAM